MRYICLMVSLLLTSNTYAAPVKNIILFIGDGMGPQQLTLALTYARQSPGSQFKKDGLHIERLMRQGKTAFMLTYPNGALVVDSAAAATQMSTGAYAGSEMIGVDYQGNKQTTILEAAKAEGKATGLVSSARLTHATPAAFAAHQPHRSMEPGIAEDMIATAPDVMLSAGLQYFLPKSADQATSATHKKWRARIPKHIRVFSSRPDEIDLLTKAEREGYALAFDFGTLQKTKAYKILGLFDTYSMPSALQEKRVEKDPKRQAPTLTDMTAKAIDVLQRDQDGFFLMVEGGQIDWAGHANDAGTMLNEMIQFDKAIGTAMKFAEGRDDTLIIVTADHETGSFGFAYSRNDIPKPQRLKGDAFKQSLFQPSYNFGDPKVLDKIYTQTETFNDILRQFDKLPKKEQTPSALAKILNAGMQFEVSEQEAADILREVPNEYRIPDNKNFAAKTWPAVQDFKEFFVAGKAIQANLIRQAIAKEQQVV